MTAAEELEAKLNSMTAEQVRDVFIKVHASTVAE